MPAEVTKRGEKKTNTQAKSIEFSEQRQGLAWASMRTGTAPLSPRGGLIRSSFYSSKVVIRRDSKMEQRE